VGHNADPGQRPVESVARPIAPRDRLVDPSREQELGRDLPRPLGQPDLIARHAGTALAVVALPAHPLRVDRVAQAVRPLQLMHHPIAAWTVVGVADGAAVEVDARCHDVDVVLGVRHDDVGRVAEAHALQVVPRERGPLGIAQALAGGQAQGAMMDRPRQGGVELARLAELTRQLAGRGPTDVAPHDPRLLVLQLRALLKHVFEHAAEAPPGDNLLDHALSPPLPRSPLALVVVVVERPDQHGAQAL